MIIQLLLTAAFAATMLYALSQRRRSRPIANAMVAFSIIGTFLVLFPESTGVIANIVGVGRGADLILYLFVMLTLVAIFNIHLRLRRSHDAVTELTRSIALLSAQPAVRKPLEAQVPPTWVDRAPDLDERDRRE